MGAPVLINGTRYKSPSAPAVNEPQDDQENNRTDGGHDDGRNDAGAEVDAQLGPQQGGGGADKAREIRWLGKRSAAVSRWCPDLFRG